MSDVINYIDLNALADGAFAEKLNKAIEEVARNIQDPNTEPTTKRQITVSIKFAPNKNRHMVGVQISTVTKLAATEAIGTVMLMGTNMRTGQIEVSEYFDQLKGQMSIDDMPEPVEEPAPVQEPAQPVATGKPLDLMNRGRKQEPEATNLAPVVNINDKTAQA